MPSIYHRVGSTLLILSLLSILFFLTFIYLEKPFIELLPMGGIQLIAGLYFLQLSKKITTNEEGVVATPVTFSSISELIFYQVPHWTKVIHHVSPEGNKLFSIEIATTSPLKKTMLILLPFLQLGWVFPISYVVLSPARIVLGSFTIHQTFRRCTMQCFTATGQFVGQYIEPTKKSLLKKNGHLVDKNNEFLSTIQEQSIAGDLIIQNSAGEQLAQHTFGYFPYALHPAFEGFAVTYYVQLSPTLSKEERLLFTALFATFFLQKN